MKSDPSPTLSLRAGRRSATVVLTALCVLLLAAGSAAALSLKSRGGAHRSGAAPSREAARSLTVTAPTLPALAEAEAANASAACCTSVHTPAAPRGASRRLKGRARSHALAQPRGVTRAAEGAGARSSGGAPLAQQAVPQGSATVGARAHKGLRLKRSSGRLASRSQGKREARSQAAPKVSGSTTAPAGPSVSPRPSVSPAARAASTSSAPSRGSTATASQARAKRARLAPHRSRTVDKPSPARSGAGALPAGGRAPAAALTAAPTSTKAPAAPR